jgi:hypothetical protein
MHLMGCGGVHGGTGIGAQLLQLSLANELSSCVAASIPAAGAATPHVDTQAIGVCRAAARRHLLQHLRALLLVRVLA